MAVPFDVSTLQATVDPIVVVEDVMQAERGRNASSRRGSGQYAVADNGTLAYVPGGMNPVQTN